MTSANARAPETTHTMTHDYAAHLIWTGDLGDGTATYAGYGREYRVLVEGKPELIGSAYPAYRGDPTLHNPEDIFLTSLAACHMLSYLALCARHGVRVVEYEDHPRGTLVTDRDGGRQSRVGDAVARGDGRGRIGPSPGGATPRHGARALLHRQLVQHAGAARGNHPNSEREQRMNDLAIALPDRPGALAEMGEALGRAGVSIEGGGAFVVNGAGIAHFLFADGAAARRALEAAGIRVLAKRDVLVQRLKQEVPGQLGMLTRRMAEAGVNIEVLYSDHDHRLILVADDMEKGCAVSAAWNR